MRVKENKEDSMGKIVPCLWFDDNAEEAANFYVSLFPNSRVINIARYSEEASRAAGRPEGSVMTVEFTLDGQEFLGLNGGPVFKFTEAVSFMIQCDSQEEIDRYWSKLSEGGQEVECGWVKDRYGLSWQVVPSRLGEWMRDPAAAARVMSAVLTMKKLDLGTLERAARGV
jgi:predicted 3-demethylubiquinone-9 3-methyltransferase (glyoxalase superfamily)